MVVICRRRQILELPAEEALPEEPVQPRPPERPRRAAGSMSSRSGKLNCSRGIHTYLTSGHKQADLAVILQTQPRSRPMPSNPDTGYADTGCFPPLLGPFNH